MWRERLALLKAQAERTRRREAAWERLLTLLRPERLARNATSGAQRGAHLCSVRSCAPREAALGAKLCSARSCAPCEGPPDSPARWAYGLLFSVPTLWMFFDATHKLNRPAGPGWDPATTAADLAVLLVWAVDCGLGFVTPYYDRRTCDWTMDRAKILRRHRRSRWLLADAAALIPYDIVWRLSAGGAVSRWVQIPRACRALLKTAK
eukprot:gene11601-21892_t